MPRVLVARAVATNQDKEVFDSCFFSEKRGGMQKACLI
jgi:hypothetical protein